jgi:alanine racemase
MYHIIVDYGHTPIRKHIGNNAWLLKIQDDFFNAYRPGLALYWYTPLLSQDKYYAQSEWLKPALSITSKIVSLHNIKSWEWVSYNHTRIASKDTTVAVIPFGYAEWLPRSASNKISFKLKTKHNSDYVPQIWTICMNLSSLEIEEWTDISIWDSVEIIWLSQKNSLQNLTENSDRIIYEILVWLDKNTRREIV